MSLFDNIKRLINPLSDEDDDYDEIFDDQDSPFLDERPRGSDRGVVDSRRGKVVNIHATTQLKVVLVKPERFENASEIADHLKEKRTVVVNLESTHKDICPGQMKTGREARNDDPAGCCQLHLCQVDDGRLQYGLRGRLSG